MANQAGTVMENKVLQAFVAATQEPWAARDGNVLLEKLRTIVRSFMGSERVLLIESLREWLTSSEEPSIVRAAILAKEFRLRELTDALVVGRETLSAKGSKSVWILDEALDLVQNA